MTAVSAVPRQEGSTNPTDAAPERQSTAVSFNYVQSDSFVVLLHQLRASVLVTTYQANKLLVARRRRTGYPHWSARLTNPWAWPWTASA